MTRYHLVVSPLLTTIFLASAFHSFIPNNKVSVSLLLLWEVFSTRAMRRNKQIPSSGAMGNTNHLFSLPLLLLPLLAPSVAAKSAKSEIRGGSFKGKPVPEINWMSSDIVNFTWGLTGVDNFENLMFS